MTHYAGGYGYLTFKTDKTGGAKVTGLLPDGEKVSMSASVLVDEDGENAHVYVFSAPSSYKKDGWFVVDLLLRADGTAELSGDHNGWHLPSTYPHYENTDYAIDGHGGEYGSVAALLDYYWTLLCAEGESPITMESSFREGSMWGSDEVAAQTFGENSYFNVELKGDAKGGIALSAKSPAPWKQKDGTYNYDTDKNGKAITDPSQLSFKFTKATGLFSGKATVYFDYTSSGKLQHKTASLPYNGVIVDGDEGLQGFGAAVYTGKFTTYYESTGKKSTYTRKISLPVTVSEK